MEPRFGSGIPMASVIARLGNRRLAERLVLVTAILIALAIGVAMIARGEAHIRGWEAYSIAKAVSAGHGFSFPIGGGWLFNERDLTGPDELSGYRPTAWVDPVYTYILAAIIHFAGDLHKYVGGGLNLLLFVAVVVQTFRLASEVEGVAAGYVAAGLITLILCARPAWVFQLYGTLLAALLVLTCARAALKTINAPSSRTAATLGLLTGMTILACPGAIAFLPVSLLLICIAFRRRWQLATSGAVVALLLAVAVIAPWTIRNYLAMDELVLVRTGSGQIAFVSTVATGSTIDPGTLEGDVMPPWRAGNAREAIQSVIGTASQAKRRELEQFQMDFAHAVGGDEFRAMNEAQRDNWFKQITRRYVVEHPMLSIELAAHKMLAFASATGPVGTLVFVVSILGAVVAVARRRLDLFALVLYIAAFMAPFVLVAPYFARYRIPIEPVMVVVAAVTACAIGRFFRGVAKISVRQPVP